MHHSFGTPAKCGLAAKVTLFDALIMYDFVWSLSMYQWECLSHVLLTRDHMFCHPHALFATSQRHMCLTELLLLQEQRSEVASLTLANSELQECMDVLVEEVSDEAAEIQVLKSIVATLAAQRSREKQVRP